MSLIKKSDVKNHLSTRTGASAVPAQASIHADATGYSGETSADAGVNPASAVDAPVTAAAAAEAGKPKV